MLFFQKFKEKVKRLKRETYALYLAYQDKRVGLFPKIFIFLVVVYALSPIDLIPDFIPVLGYLDDFLIIPLGISIAIKMVPKTILDECRVKADTVFKDNEPVSKTGLFMVLLIWAVLISLIVYIIIKKAKG